MLRGPRGPRGRQAHRESKVIQARKEMSDPPERQGHREFPGLKEIQARKAQQETQVRRA